MALALTLTIAGAVAPEVVKVQVNGVVATLSGGTYTADVPVTSGIVSVTSVTAAGVESVRTLQVVASGTAPV
jgi:hypothetical protein